MHGGSQVNLNVNTLIAAALGFYAWRSGNMLLGAAAVGVWYLQPISPSGTLSLTR